MKKWIEQYELSQLILHEDSRFLIANKPPGVPVQKDKTGDTSLLEFIENSLNASFHIHTRIDRPVSGIVVLEKSKIQDKGILPLKHLSKEYLAIVPKLNQPAGRLTHYLKRDGIRRRALISDTPEKGFKMGQLDFEVTQQLDRYDLLCIRTSTGRYHQIRAQLAHMGYPIRGDVKYGARRAKRDRSIDLHAWRISMEPTLPEISAPRLGPEDIWSNIDFNSLP